MDQQGSTNQRRPDWNCVQGGHDVYTAHTWAKLARTLKLSPRELQISKAVFDDHNEVVIADSLEISVHTVHTHLKRLYQKLAVNSRVELVVRIVSIERVVNGHTT